MWYRMFVFLSLYQKNLFTEKIEFIEYMSLKNNNYVNKISKYIRIVWTTGT